MSTSLDKALAVVQQAVDADFRKDYDSALRLYTHACEWFMHTVRFEPNPAIKQRLRSKVSEYLTRCEQIKEMLDEKRRPAPVAAPASSGSKEESDSEKLNAALRGAIITEKPDVKWSDVAGLDNVKEALEEAVELPMQAPHLFTGNRRPWDAILLHGVPGTGKSFIAKALAAKVDATFFSVSSSDLVSKWLGESERLVRALFTMAREAAQNQGRAVIFIDEIDSIGRARSDGENESASRIKTELLTQMQGVGRDLKGILVLGATNVPWLLDSALLRRFQKRINVPAPDAAARIHIMKTQTGTTAHNITGDQWRQLGILTAGYSGSDCSNVVRDALMQPIRLLRAATHFHMVAGKYVPCSGGQPGAVEMSWRDAKDNLYDPVITFEDFERSIENTKSTVRKEDVEMHQMFAEESEPN